MEFHGGVSVCFLGEMEAALYWFFYTEARRHGVSWRRKRSLCISAPLCLCVFFWRDGETRREVSE